MPDKRGSEYVIFECPTLKGIAHLTFDHRQSFSDRTYEPIGRKVLVYFNCDGVRRCGICPQISPTSWGAPEWSRCAYPELRAKGVTGL